MTIETGVVPIQPVPKPILCNPYEEPRDHWLYNRDTGLAHQAGSRRKAGYWYKTERTGSAQRGLFADEEFDDLPLVNLLREDVKRWREADYRGASPVTRDLLRHWARPDRQRRLFFCQREAVETVIYLAEIRFPKRTSVLRFKPALSDEDLDKLCRGEKPSAAVLGEAGGSATDWFPRLIDQPAEAGLLGLRRLGCKMATGSGKTVVMSMLISWAFCNRAQNPMSTEFPAGVLVLCPNLTVKERLQVLRPENPKNYYAEFDIVPVKYRDLLSRGKVIVENWHQLTTESPHAEGGETYRVVDKGEEDAAAFARRVLGDLFDRMPIMVLNDEGHHCWRPRPVEEDEDDALDEVDKDEAEEAKVWLGGLDRLNNCGALGKGVPGIGLCVDLSATPFYIKGSGHPEGSPFPWLVSDFGLVDAIESGIVKIPRLPVSDTTGRPDPRYFRLWKTISDELEPGERLPGRRGGKPKPDVIWRKAEGALQQLAAQWKEKFEYDQGATVGQERVPPVLIVVCDNTDIAELFYQKISGETTEQLVTEAEVAEVLGSDNGDDDEPPPKRKRGEKKQQPKVIYGQGEVFPDLLSNTPERKYTIRIDSKLLAEAESDVPGKSRSDAAEALRRVVSTVGKPGEPGEHVRCVVSVAMLTEGWDASNVTQILGLRAFQSQLLCEQVVGRGLRRMDYKPDPTTGLLAEEYVDVYGIPFSVVPFKGRAAAGKAPEDKPKNHVQAVEERKSLRLEFPVVEGYVFALRRNLIRCDIDKMEPLELEPNREPTATFLRLTAGYAEGTATAVGSPFPTIRQDRAAYYRDNHVESIKFEIAKLVLDRLLSAAGGSAAADTKARVLRLQSRHQLFPQVFRYVDEYIRRRVDFRGSPPGEIGLDRYTRQIIERLSDGIQPDEGKGEPPLLPVLNRIKPIGSTDDVDFKTVKRTVATQRSHVNQVVLDTNTWEATAVFQLDSAPAVKSYVRNGGLGFTIPYEYEGQSHSYEPDFIVRLANDLMVVLEIKGFEDNQDRAKHEAAAKWARAVTNWGRLGTWQLHVCRDPALLGSELAQLQAMPVQ